MKLRLSAILCAFSLCVAATAQVDNCCFVGWQCNNDQEWVNGYHAYLNGQCAAPAQPAGTATGAIDNCCFVDRQCHSDAEWTDGYWAFQRNECPAGTTSAQPTAPQQIPAGVDNCCHVNQQCATEAEWIRGWEAFRDYLCDPEGQSPEFRDVGVKITGIAGFREQMVESLLLMRRQARYWYDYTVRVLKGIVQTFSYENTYVDTITGIFYLNYDGTYPRGFTRYEHLVFTATILVHEACHIHREQAGLESGGLVGERACTEKQLEAHVAIDPNDPRANEHRETLATIHDPSTWWW